MAFTPKNWQDTPSVATPITALALEDMETRVTDYSDDLLVPVTGGMPLVANDHGVVADGTTDDTAAWEAIIAGLADGQSVTWYGLSVVEPGLEFIGRVALVGQSPLRSAFKIAGGTTTNDGIIFGGSDGPRYGHTLRGFSILGGVACCDNALVLLNLIDPTVDVWVRAGATGYGASIEGVHNAEHCYIRCSNNSPAALPYTGTAPANGIRIVGSSLIPTNANQFQFRAEGLAGIGVMGDGGVGAAGSFSNYISGVVQGNAGNGLDLTLFTEFSVHDLHVEANTGTDILLDSCQRGVLGPGLLVDGTTSIVNCDHVVLDGITSVNLAIDSASTYISRRRITINGGTDTDTSTAETVLVDVASATTITIPKAASVVNITGTTNIENITATYAGHVVSMLFNGVLTVADSVGNMSLAGNFGVGPAGVLTMFCDGTYWREVARSVN